MDRLSIEGNWRLAGCFQELGRLEEAKSLLLQAVSLGRASQGPQHPDVANMLSNLGEVLHLTGEWEAAEVAFDESLAIRRKVWGDEHVTVANSLNIMAFLFADQERYEEAEPLYIQSLDMRRRLYGPRRFEVTFALNGLARLYLRTDRPVEAEELLRESLSIVDETVPRHWRRGYAESLLGAALTLQGRRDEARPLLDRGLAIVREARGEDDYFTREISEYCHELDKASGKAWSDDPEDTSIEPTRPRTAAGQR
jgi:tetratricopeptide (TPR) repeat protein